MSDNPALQHEEVVVRRGRRTGVALVVAVHSRVLGPAIGGCRMRRYADWRDGVTDALRLSTAMTYKCAVAGLPFGGGKSVIALPEDAEPSTVSRRAVLEDMGELIASFDGSYLTGPDVGTGPDDMLLIRSITPHVFCLPEAHGGTGSSSGPTAAGVLAALRAGARHVFGTGTLSGRVAVVSGLGAVGSLLARGLREAGARVIASDVDAAKRRFAADHDLDWVDPEDALGVPADVVVPAAVGGVLGPGAVRRLAAPLVVGPANNQLTDDSVAGLLAARGTVWIPDFVASAGGVVYTLARELDGLDHDAALARVETIGDTVAGLLDAARAAGTTPLREATALADRRLARP